MKKIITTLIIVILANAVFIGIVLAESTKGTVTASELNFRESANINANAIDVLYKGAKVNIISEEGDWYKVKYNNEEGYVSKQYIKRDKETNSTNTANTQTNTSSQNSTDTPTNNVVAPTVTPSGMETPSDIIELNKTKIKSATTLYVLPLINSTKLENLSANASVQLVSVNGDWAYVQTENNSGWVFKKVLEKTTITLATNNLVPTTTNAPQNNNTTSANTVENTTANNTTSETTVTPTPTATLTPTTTPQPSNDSYPTTMYVNVEAVNVRSKANTSSEVVTSVEKNVPIIVEGKEGDWYKVKTSDGNGYIRSDLLSKTR